MKKSLFLSLTLALVLFAVALISRPPANSAPFSASVSGSDVPSRQFSRAEQGSTFDFPLDFGPHKDYQTEWWYYTGNLQDAGGRKFGYQLTFFRRALIPRQELSSRDSNWASSNIYMAHFAVTDHEGQEFYAFERFSREGLGLAGAESLPFQVWLEDWRVEQIEADEFRLTANSEGISIELTLTDRKGPILHGLQGYSQKGPEAGNASYYYSQSRLQSEGTIRLGEMAFQVSGLSWKDHEFSTNALSPGQVGWDWFSIQLDDQREIMLFQLRRSDGSIDPYSAATIINADGSTRSLSSEEFYLETSDEWQSPHSGARYPMNWRIRIPNEEIELHLTPLIKDQELKLSFIYWEGAVLVEGIIKGSAVNGTGYVEMTGYESSMEGQF